MDARIWIALAALAVSGVITLGLTALVSRIQRGRFRVTRRSPSETRFASDFGSFRIDAATRKLGRLVDGRTDNRPLDQVEALSYEYERGVSWFSEVLFGASLYDVMLPQYRDALHAYRISLVLAGGERIPVFAAAQVERRELWQGWWFALVYGLLAKLGLYRNVDDYARGVLDELQALFRAAGRELPLE